MTIEQLSNLVLDALIRCEREIALAATEHSKWLALHQYVMNLKRIRLQTELPSSDSKSPEYLLLSENVNAVVIQQEAILQFLVEKTTMEIQPRSQQAKESTLQLRKILSTLTPPLDLFTGSERRTSTSFGQIPFTGSYTDDLSDWMKDRLQQCLRDVQQADGASEKAKEVWECASDVQERTWREAKEGARRVCEGFGFCKDEF